MKNEQGITLVALVITIIILIILAGVGISLSIGENGIFKRAGQAKEEYINAQIEEEKSINELSEQIVENVNIEENKKLYLYNYGDECIDVTGGWVEGAYSNGATGSKNEESLYINCPYEKSVYTTYIFRTNSTIDVSEYKTINCVITISNIGGNERCAQLGFFSNEYQYYTNNVGGTHIKTVANGQSIITATTECEKQIFSTNLTEDTINLYGYVEGRAGGDANNQITMNIYQIWLEK